MAGREGHLPLEKEVGSRVLVMIENILHKGPHRRGHHPKDHHHDIQGIDTKTDIERGREENMIIHHPNAQVTRTGLEGSILPKKDDILKECKEKILVCKGVTNKEWPIPKEESPPIREGEPGRDQIRVMGTKTEEGPRTK
ncbi:MAG: hypothetical protein JSW00_10400 [Thermoplasmata archaeon]|nr:MAG: hypothetical protein JSW00_10400 [Thermoplasmata archaeon]